MNCPKCNTAVNDDAVFCNDCGYKLSGDGQILSTNALTTVQEKSAKIFDRTTYSTLTKVLFFSASISVVGGVLGMFNQLIGGYIFAIPVAFMYLVIVYRAIMTFIDINAITDEILAQELRHMLTFFAYSLFLITIASMVLGISFAIESWEVVALFTVLLSVLSGLVAISIIISFVIFLAASVRIKQK